MVAFVKLFTLAVSLCKCSLLLLLGPHFIAGLLPVNVQSSLRNLNKLRSNVATYEKSTVEIEYTSMSSKDVPKLARMISANFDGPYSWWQKPLEVYSVWTLECQLSDRYEKFMVQKERDHLMLVARVEGAAVGFVEVGLVPLAQELRKIGETSLNTRWGQMDIDDKTMFPYVGNVVVDQSYRRKGIALSLMNQALASTKAWGGAFAFCAVHTENEAASDLYLNKLGFRIFRLEKGSDNFFNPDKRSRYILVKEFPVESETETTAVEEKEEEEEERGREGEDVLADAAIYNDDDDDDDDEDALLDDNEKFSYLKMKQKFELENKEKDKEKEKDKVDNEVVGMRDALMWGDDLSRIERIDYSDLLATTESTTLIQAEFDVEVEVADGI